jgi:hypothetical protein
MTNKEEIFELLQQHPEGLDDDDITKITGIQSRQQVQQLCNQLAHSKRIRRHSVEKTGKRRKIHNFPVDPNAVSVGSENESKGALWRRRLSALVAATNRQEADLLDEALQLLAMKVLRNGSEMDSASEAQTFSGRPTTS